MKLTKASSGLSAAVLLSMLLVGCGGGGGGGTPAESSGVLADGFGPGNAAGCPKSVFSDIWINNRLGCLAVGQAFVNGGLKASGTKADRAFLISQSVADQSLNNPLGGSVARHYKYFLCVRNAPAGLTGQAASSDLADALGIGSVLRTLYFPPDVTSNSLRSEGAVDSVVAVTCDRSVHPVVVDFNTGKVESVNSAALPNLQIYDH
ncbi:MAG: hypothetical protein CFE44_16455 [Burkholderiales bacterium PBB4]|nr:MAG: hypothetical protein CFE44_16455 [Burkholderiales bacterium PBB4]